MAVPRTFKRGLETLGLHSNRLTTETLLASIRAATHNLESIQRLPALDLPFIPQTSYALSASAVRIILNDVVLHRRRCVVEFGSGLSTLYLSRVLQEYPGSVLISVDHDTEWLGYVGAQLERMGTAACARLVHAPLEPVAGKTPGVRWYARSVMEATLADEAVDAAIIDGPKARHANDAETRSHALPFLLPRLNPAGAAVFLDDIKRPGERLIYERWAYEFAMEPVRDAEFCGLGILVPRGRPLKFKLV